MLILVKNILQCFLFNDKEKSIIKICKLKHPGSGKYNKLFWFHYLNIFLQNTKSVESCFHFSSETENVHLNIMDFLFEGSKKRKNF